MGGMDFTAQQQLEEERMFMLLAILQRVARGMSNQADALVLASELGLTTEHRRNNHEMA